MSLQERWLAAETFGEYLEGVEKNRQLWQDLYERAAVPDDLLEEARGLSAGFPGGCHLLALSEDWCGDAVTALPVVARLAEAMGGELRVLGRDANPDLMDAHLTGSSRSIPVVMVLDADFREQGWWGPRPSELQEWVMSVGLSMPSPDRYREIRRWFARDRGRSTVRELLDLMAACCAVG